MQSYHFLVKEWMLWAQFSLIRQELIEKKIIAFYAILFQGFEDCYVLYQTFKKYSLAAAFEEFSKIRIVDGNAISDLSMYNYLEVNYETSFF